jgi:peptidoglycan/xylan/chitin deacetylase (PgdA/CDA1 family)
VTTTAHRGRSVALTFDDGPNPTYTPQVLALLDRYGAHATFCEIGDAAQAYPALVRQVVAHGDRLCDHTMTHDENLGIRTQARIGWQISTAEQVLAQLSGGAPISHYRQPGGNWTPTIQQIAAQRGMRNLSWSVDPRDWSTPGTSAIISRVEGNLRPGSVLLMHDGDGDVPPGGGDRSETVAALAVLLPWMIAQGYSFDFPA